jgi:DNA repair protein RAD5
MDVVIVSYNTLAQELSHGPPQAVGNKRGRDAGGLLDMDYFRIILDEAHTIRNRETKMFKAIISLKSVHRWALSGTPIVNRSDDAFSLFAFLRAQPCNTWEVFNRAVARPIKDGDTDGINRLRAFFSGISIRRTKELISKMIPPKVVTLVTLRMSEKQREAYMTLFSSAQAAIRAAFEDRTERTLGSVFSSVLVLIMRLRQACDDITMGPSDLLARAASVLADIVSKDAKDGKSDDVTVRKLIAEDAVKLFAALKGVLHEEDPTDCCICLETLTEETSRILKTCKHVLCEVCSEGLMTSGRSLTCPLCRAPFTKEDLIEAASIKEAAASEEIVDDTVDTATSSSSSSAAAGGCGGSSASSLQLQDEVVSIPSPKVFSLIESLKSMHSEDDKNLKAVVFSQFTSFLDVISHHLDQQGIVHSRLDGGMSMKRRTTELNTWRKNNSQEASTSVLLISTKAGGQGLNLTQGSRV